MTEIFATGHLYHYQYYLYYQNHRLFIDRPTLMLSRYPLNKSDPKKKKKMVIPVMAKKHLDFDQLRRVKYEA